MLWVSVFEHLTSNSLLYSIPASILHKSFQIACICLVIYFIGYPHEGVCVCVFMCIVYLCVCKCVHANANAHTHTHVHQMGMNVPHRCQRTTQDVLFALFPPYSFETGFLTEPGARLVTSKPQTLAVSAPPLSKGLQAHRPHTTSYYVPWLL